MMSCCPPLLANTSRRKAPWSWQTSIRSPPDTSIPTTTTICFSPPTPRTFSMSTNPKFRMTSTFSTSTPCICTSADSFELIAASAPNISKTTSLFSCGSRTWPHANRANTPKKYLFPGWPPMIVTSLVRDWRLSQRCLIVLKVGFLKILRLIGRFMRRYRFNCYPQIIHRPRNRVGEISSPTRLKYDGSKRDILMFSNVD